MKMREKINRAVITVRSALLENKTKILPAALGVNLVMATTYCGDVAKAVDSTMGWVFGILRVVGLIVGVVGLIILILGIKDSQGGNGDTNKVQSGVLVLIVGLVICLGIPAFLKLCGVDDPKKVGTTLIGDDL